MKIKNLSEKYSDFVVDRRRFYHGIPELSLQEYETTKSLVKDLKDMGVDEVITFPDYQGVIGIIKGGKPGKTVMLRADIDGLPVEEKTCKPYASTNGNMHACGHDAHMAMQLGAAKILVDLKDELQGNVKLLFQSGEEVALGAKYYVENGYLDDVDAVYGVHIWPDIEAGKFSLEAGERMASADRFNIIVEGESAHGSAPHLGKDAIFAASSIVMNLQSFISRVNNPLNSAVLTIGTINGGQRFNIIANRVEMEGTTRTFSRETRNSIEEEMRKIIENTGNALGVKASLEYEYMTSPIINEHEDLIKLAQNAAEKLFGSESLGKMEKLLGAEDFCFLMDKVPGFFGFVGCYNEEVDAVYNNHNDKFDVDESTLYMGSALAAQFAYDFLNS
ncbi:MAG: amidohydrolase [Tissierellaceae bacterium]|nr:amidohydrolase [Tissierellaceae bacterium]